MRSSANKPFVAIVADAPQPQGQRSAREMKTRKTGIVIASTGCLLVAFLVLQCFPIMQVSDGCECGCKRVWYEMPNSLWHRHRFGMKIEDVGNGAHAHVFWDAQWGVWRKLPWQK